MFLLLITNFILFTLGNYIYTTEYPLIIKVLTSELCFIILYTLVDKGNIKYGWKFTAISIFVALQFIFPIYNNLFYSVYVQYFSILISTTAILVNSLLIRKLLSNGLTKILSSRISTTGSSIIEIICFAFLLEIGFVGASLTALVRLLYIIIIPKIVFRNK